MEVFSYTDFARSKLLTICRIYGIKFQNIQLVREEQRYKIVAHVEGHVSQSLSPTKIRQAQKVWLECNLDVDFPDGTRAVAHIEEVYKGVVLFIYRITWERDSTYTDW